jgi:probable rRNA maturation factor
MGALADNPWMNRVRMLNGPSLQLTAIVVTNTEIEALNATYRGKPQPTDVLTFSLLEEAPPADTTLAQLPHLDLGEIYLSLPWACVTLSQQYTETPRSPVNFLDNLSLFLIERLTHGALHLLGVHHETPTAYNNVIAIQQQVLHALDIQNRGCTDS